MSSAATKLVLLSIFLLFACISGNGSHARDEGINVCAEAASKCNFRFAGSRIAKISLDDRVDTPLTPPIISRLGYPYLGILNSNIEPEVVFDGLLFPISSAPLNPKISKSIFKPFSYQYTSAMGFENMNDDQKRFLRGFCIRVYFSSYQVLDEQGNVRKNFNNVPKYKKKCVVFKVV